MAVQTMKYEVKFLTPAFLGNAEQSGQWRTPPFKALLRQWWRVAVANEVGYDHKRLREREAKLFGHVWPEEDVDGKGQKQKVAARASKVRLRLDRWSPGELTTGMWPSNDFHKVQVRSDLYLGFGPVLASSKNERRSAPHLAHDAIGPSQKATLDILARGCGDEERRLIDAMRLVHLFGTLGSRSRNGWGSLHAKLEKADEREPTDQLLARVTRSLEQSLGIDWASALGTDSKGLLAWVTKKPLDSWMDAVNEFARILVEVRRKAKDYKPSERSNGLNGIHLLGYPAGGKWRLDSWGVDQRLASQLRFKLVSLDERLVGMVFHMPCSVPESLVAKLSTQDRTWLCNNQIPVWRKIHGKLDTMAGLHRLDGSTLARVEE